MNIIKNLFDKKHKSQAKITRIIKKPVPKKYNLENSSFEDCKTFGDCVIVASSSLKVSTPSDEAFKNFIQENSEHLKEALEKHESSTSRTDSVDVATNKIIETSSKAATPTKIKKSLRRVLGEATNVISGI